MTVLYGRYTGDDQVGGSSGNGYLNYWLASSNENESDRVWGVYGSGSCLSYYDFCTSNYSGVRPVIEISESAVQEV